MDVSLDVGGRCGVRCFVLVWFFVVKVAADCSIPQETDILVLTDETRLKNDFPEGIDITFECVKGYLKKGGTGIATCAGDKWSEADLHCEKKDCGPPDPMPHMRFNTSEGTLFGAKVEVSCDRGFDINGIGYKRCLATGWVGRSACVNITCEIPPAVANGRSSWDAQDEPKYGERITYTCDDGYTLTGTSTIMCSDGGEYDSEPPECEGPMAEDILSSSPTFQTPEASTSADAPATPTASRDKTVRATKAPTVAPSQQEGGKDFYRTTATASASSTPPSTFQDKPTTDTTFDYKPVIVSVICVSVVVCIVVFFLYKCLHRRKGSYDTREDLKPELLQFQNL